MPRQQNISPDWQADLDPPTWLVKAHAGSKIQNNCADSRKSLLDSETNEKQVV